MPLIAEQGIAAFSLEELAGRADVTRNLLYHYFPRGRADILIAVGERAGHELTDGWITDETIPLPERVATNLARFIEHAEEPSVVWQIHRLARTSDEPEVRAVIERFERVVIDAIALNNLGSTEISATATLALRAFIAFSETVLDSARESGVPTERAQWLIAQSLVATMQIVRSAPHD